MKVLPVMAQSAIRLSLAPILAALCLLAGPCAQAASRDQSNAMWTAPSGGDMSALRYGNLTEIESPLFNLSCFKAMGIAVLDIHDAIGQPQSGAPLEIELSAGGISMSLKGTATRDPENGDVYAEATEFPVTPVLNVLEKTGPLTVKVGSVSLSYSDLNRQAALKDFQKSCQLK